MKTGWHCPGTALWPRAAPALLTWLDFVIPKKSWDNNSYSLPPVGFIPLKFWCESGVSLPRTRGGFLQGFAAGIKSRSPIWSLGHDGNTNLAGIFTLESMTSVGLGFIRGVFRGINQTSGRFLKEGVCFFFLGKQSSLTTSWPLL